MIFPALILARVVCCSPVIDGGLIEKTLQVDSVHLIKNNKRDAARAHQSYHALTELNAENQTAEVTVKPRGTVTNGAGWRSLH